MAPSLRSAVSLLLAFSLSAISLAGLAFAEDRTDAIVYEILQDIEGPHHRAWFVRNDGTGNAPTIQAAVDSAADGDYVVLSHGTFTGPGNRDVDFLGKAITVISESGSQARTAIDCDGVHGNHRGFVFQNGEGPDSRVVGISINEGFKQWGGAVICTLASSPTFIAVGFKNNYALMKGGGMYCDSLSAPTLIGCRFVGNTAFSGGGFSSRNSSTRQITMENVEFIKNRGNTDYGGAGAVELFFTNARLTGCRFAKNEAAFGGAVATQAGFDGTWIVAFHDCDFEGNSCTTAGGAIHMTSGSVLAVDSCRFANNEAVVGAAIHIDTGGPTTVTRDCLFTENEGLYCIIYSEGSSLDRSKKYERCTFVHNRVGPDGGLFMHYNVFQGPLEIENTIAAFNDCPVVMYCADAGGESPIFTCCDLYGNSGGDWDGCVADQAGANGNFSADPLFCDTAAADYALNGASPCLDADGCGLIGAYGAGCFSFAVGVDAFDVPAGTPLIAPNTPNPFNPSTTISYALPAAGHVRLTIHDTAGRLVQVLLDGERSAGPGEIAWNGKDRAGIPVPSGIYFARIAIEGHAETRKMLLIR